MIEFEVGGNNYRAEKLNAIQQFHLSRRLAPLIPPLIPVFLQIQASGISNLNALSELMQPFAESIATMKDADAEYVIEVCLGCTRRQVGDHWATVWSDSAKAVMFDDLNDLSVVLQIVVKVIQDNLGNFMAGLAMRQQALEAGSKA